MIEVAVVMAALPNIASAGAQPPLKLPFHSSTPNSERTILMGPYLRHGKYACVAGASAAPPATVEVITDVTAQVMAGYVTPIIGDTTRHYQGNPPEKSRAHVTADARNFPQRSLNTPHYTPQTSTTTMRHGPGPRGADNH